ncbi:DUF3105 domain-containing protein [Phytomonospora endophytica]|uniref:DUF3105 domain-containing protein n=1 Tax=Phytomonospora endophytica TaxID=714109 RepID=A0A841FHD7_9ACTN|nr:DUF3105 domain-containing protein [Phytomonospora endophytica]MBB6032982.1 hypothetical protein [Phytomonospora endophytica]GIG65208.1 hypothetical protein Pen01_15030 [Phytomonospora endophytica]
MGKKGRGSQTGTRSGAGTKGAGATRKRTPIVVPKAGPNWGMVALYGVVGVVVLALLGYIGFTAWDKSRSMTDRAEAISGVTNFRASTDLGRDHVDGDQTYGQTPPVGGNHNGAWETCNGIVYTQQIPDEHAVHSLEHGAVWITYRPDLPADQVAKLATRVEGKDYTLMSPYPGLDAPISLQAWGFQLKVDSADDARINEFIEILRLKASVEDGATCSGGVQATGTTPSSGEGM